MTGQDKTQKNGTDNPKRVFVSRAQVLSKEKRSQLSVQEKAFEAQCQDRGVWLELFCPDDACLSEEERFSIPVFCEDTKVKDSIFFELFCPDDSCDVFEPTRLP